MATDLPRERLQEAADLAGQAFRILDLIGPRLEPPAREVALQLRQDASELSRRLRNLAVAEVGR